MTDLARPDLDSLFVAFPDELRAAVEAVLTMMESGEATGMPVGAKRLSSSAASPQAWDGTTWADLCAIYRISAERLGGATRSALVAQVVTETHAAIGAARASLSVLSRYYTSSQVDAAIAAARPDLTSLYSQTEMDALYVLRTALAAYATRHYLASKIDALRLGSDGSDHDHDGRYDTKAVLADKIAAFVAAHVAGDAAYRRDETYTQAEADTVIDVATANLTARLDGKLPKPSGGYAGRAGHVLLIGSDGLAIESAAPRDWLLS